MKPFTGNSGGKIESVRSLLTPIFQYCGINTETYDAITDVSLMDKEFLRSAGWIKPDWIWCYRSEDIDYTIKLPKYELVSITCTQARLLFDPHHILGRHAPQTRRRRGTSSQPVPTAAEDDPIPEFAHQYALAPTPPVPMETAVFQRYVVDSFQSVWNVMASLFHCGCIRCTDEVPPAQP